MTRRIPAGTMHTSDPDLLSFRSCVLLLVAMPECAVVADSWGQTVRGIITTSTEAVGRIPAMTA